MFIAQMDQIDAINLFVRRRFFSFLPDMLQKKIVGDITHPK